MKTLTLKYSWLTALMILSAGAEPGEARRRLSAAEGPEPADGRRRFP